MCLLCLLCLLCLFQGRAPSYCSTGHKATIQAKKLSQVIYVYHPCVYIYIYIYICLVRHGNVLMFFYGFHRRDSRGLVAAGNHEQKPTTETIRNRSLPRQKPLQNQRWKPLNKRNVLPATTETIFKRSSDGNQS